MSNNQSPTNKTNEETLLNDVNKYCKNKNPSNAQIVTETSITKDQYVKKSMEVVVKIIEIMNYTITTANDIVNHHIPSIPILKESIITTYYLILLLTISTLFKSILDIFVTNEYTVIGISYYILYNIYAIFYYIFSFVIGKTISPELGKEIYDFFIITMNDVCMRLPIIASITGGMKTITGGITDITKVLDTIYKMTPTISSPTEILSIVKNNIPGITTGLSFKGGNIKKSSELNSDLKRLNKNKETTKLREETIKLREEIKNLQINEIKQTIEEKIKQGYDDKDTQIILEEYNVLEILLDFLNKLGEKIKNIDEKIKPLMINETVGGNKNKTRKNRKNRKNKTKTKK